MPARPLIVVIGLSMLAGCTATQQASCEARADPTMSAHLAGLACSDSQQDQYEVGLAYETGAGVTADPEAAAKWYRKAARYDSGTTSLFAPPTAGGREKFGTALEVRIGPELEGLAAAKYRLGLLYLEGRGVVQSRKKAKSWLRRAARQGHEEAAQALERLDSET